MSKVQSHLRFLTSTTVKPTYPLFIFLPGMDGTGKLLRVQTAGLEKIFDVRCLVIPPDDLTDWDQLAEQVVALVQAELATGPQRSVYLCGESFGGCLAIKVALKALQLFDRMILVNPASSFNQRPWIGWSARLAQWLPQPLYQSTAVALLPLLASWERIAPDDRQALLKVVGFVPQKTSIWRLSLLRQFRLDEQQLQNLNYPVLLIASQADRLLPSLAEAQRLTGILPNARAVILPNSGHACLLEERVNLYEILQAENFVGGLPATSEGAVLRDH